MPEALVSQGLKFPVKPTAFPCLQHWTLLRSFHKAQDDFLQMQYMTSTFHEVHHLLHAQSHHASSAYTTALILLSPEGVLYPAIR
ncbi:hypothetical protein D3C75_1048690 [compost metagenome]